MILSRYMHTLIIHLYISHVNYRFVWIFILHNGIIEQSLEEKHRFRVIIIQVAEHIKSAYHGYSLFPSGQ